jgi:hypothetical protein
LRRESRNSFINKFLHFANFDKRAKGEFQVITLLSREEFLEKKGPIGSAIARMAELMYGKKEGQLVREKWKEMSGEGLRSREFATLVDVILRYGGVTYLSLSVAALMILLIVQGYENEGG